MGNIRQVQAARIVDRDRIEIRLSLRPIIGTGGLFVALAHKTGTDDWIGDGDWRLSQGPTVDTVCEIETSFAGVIETILIHRYGLQAVLPL